MPKTILDQPYDCCHGDPALIPWVDYRHSLCGILFFPGVMKQENRRLSHHQPPTGACIWVSTAMVVPFRPCAVSSSCHLTVYLISLLLAWSSSSSHPALDWSGQVIFINGMKNSSQHLPLASLMKPPRRHSKRDPHSTHHFQGTSACKCKQLQASPLPRQEDSPSESRKCW